MTQIAQPQVHVPNLRGRRALTLAALGALLIAATVVMVVIANGSGHNGTSVPRTQPKSAALGVDAGPSPGTPSALSQAFGTQALRGGFSMTTNVPALPRGEAGPTDGTPSAVAEALGGRVSRFPPPGSLTTNVPALPSADAGPSTGTPTAVRDALSAP